jgi:hypothetical protein
MRRRFWDLFIASFVALFFEMLLVRWLPTTIYYLGYYKNCILFSTFLGFGCGLATRRRADRGLAYFAPLVAAGVLGASIIEQYTRIIPPESGEFLWPQAKSVSIAMPMVLLLAIVFTAGAGLMIPLGRVVGQYLEGFPPITAYSINIAASLLGVLGFLLISYLRFAPVAWFTVAILPVLYLVRTDRRGLLLNSLGLIAAVGVVLLFRSGEDLWSPYSKISLTPVQPLINARELMTNNNGHQVMYDLSEKRLARRYDDPEGLWHLAQAHVYIYGSAYQILQPRSVLIVGGGTGNEAASAVRHGVGRIDVVEIDPVIISIGRALHPEQPYLNGHVRIINDDARHYMATTSERYDLIIVGFLDSTSHLSSMSNIRLDNYVYTAESFKQARALLNPGGVLQVTYYALANFVRLRIFSMLQTAFDQPPLMTELAEGARGDVIFFEGPAVSAKPEFVPAGLKLQRDGQQYRALARSALPVTDDWPYLNVLGRSIGNDYLIGLATMIVISFLFIQFFVWPSGVSVASSAMSWCFFLQGAGFMLLETNTITRMALIFGSTWIVTSVAVILVLLAALVSNVIVQRFAFPSIFTVIGLVAASVLLNYAVDIHYYLGLPEPVRTSLAALQVYLPMLGSSLLFGRLFQRSAKSSYDLGMNILGALFGGMLEYVSLVIGVQAVYLLALILFVAIILPYRRVDLSEAS